MTIFVLSHNLQLESAVVPSISAEDLAQGLFGSSSLITKADALSHPHWLVRIESALSADEMANELVKAWKQYRLNQGHSTEHHWLASGAASWVAVETLLMRKPVRCITRMPLLRLLKGTLKCVANDGLDRFKALT